MIDHPTTLLYLSLRKEGKIGKLWTEGDNCHKLAPADALPGMEYRLAEFISSEHLIALIHDLSGLRKPPVRAVHSGYNNWVEDSDVRGYKKRA